MVDTVPHTSTTPDSTQSVFEPGVDTSTLHTHSGDDADAMAVAHFLRAAPRTLLRLRLAVVVALFVMAY